MQKFQEIRKCERFYGKIRKRAILGPSGDAQTGPVDPRGLKCFISSTILLLYLHVKFQVSDEAIAVFKLDRG